MLPINHQHSIKNLQVNLDMLTPSLISLTVYRLLISNQHTYIMKLLVMLHMLWSGPMMMFLKMLILGISQKQSSA